MQDEDLSEARRVFAQQALQDLVGFPVDPEQVVVGDATALGATGIESVLTYQSLLKRVQTGDVLRQSQGSFRPGR